MLRADGKPIVWNPALDDPIRAPRDDERAEEWVFEGSCTVKSNDPGTGQQVGLFPE